MARDYIIGKDKCLVHTNSSLIEGWEPCTDIKVIQAFAKDAPKELVEGMRWKGSKLPVDVLSPVLGTIEQFKRMETAFTLYYRLADNTWRINCPIQSGAGASVRFVDNGNEVGDGYALMGSIHTHPEMGAFWSGTDMNDQQKKHGLHFVFGLKDGKVAHTKVSIFTPSGCYDQNLEDVIDPIDFAAEHKANDEWVNKIKAQELKVSFSPQRQAYHQIPGSSMQTSSRYRYTGRNGWEHCRPANHSIWDDDWWDNYKQPTYDEDFNSRVEYYRQRNLTNRVDKAQDGLSMYHSRMIKELSRILEEFDDRRYKQDAPSKCFVCEVEDLLDKYGYVEESDDAPKGDALIMAVVEAPVEVKVECADHLLYELADCLDKAPDTLSADDEVFVSDFLSLLHVYGFQDSNVDGPTEDTANNNPSTEATVIEEDDFNGYMKTSETDTRNNPVQKWGIIGKEDYD